MVSKQFEKGYKIFSSMVDFGYHIGTLGLKARDYNTKVKNIEQERLLKHRIHEKQEAQTLATRAWSQKYYNTIIKDSIKAKRAEQAASALEIKDHIDKLETSSYGYGIDVIDGDTVSNFINNERVKAELTKEKLGADRDKVIHDAIIKRDQPVFDEEYKEIGKQVDEQAKNKFWSTAIESTADVITYGHTSGFFASAKRKIKNAFVSSKSTATVQGTEGN